MRKPTCETAGSQNRLEGRHRRELYLFKITIHTVLDGEMAVPCNPQSALAGLNSHPRYDACKACLVQVVLTIGSCATETHEPGQVRKEAAISGFFCVPQTSLIELTAQVTLR